MVIVSHKTTVRTPAGFAFDIARDVRRWPEFMAVLDNVCVLKQEAGETTVELREDVGRKGFVAVYRVRSTDDRRIVSKQIAGRLAAMDVEWTLRETETGTAVEVTHQFRSGWPMIGPLVDRFVIPPFFLSKIVPKTLENFRVLVEEEYAVHAKRRRRQRTAG